MSSRASVLLATALALGAPLSGVAADVKDSRPNILFILADDFRPDCIAARGNSHIKTPALDTLVERGVSFSHAYVMGAMQGAVCQPSRCMIQTGRSLFHLPRVQYQKGYAEFA